MATQEKKDFSKIGLKKDHALVTRLPDFFKKAKRQGFSTDIHEHFHFEVGRIEFFPAVKEYEGAIVYYQKDMATVLKYPELGTFDLVSHEHHMLSIINQ